MSEAQRDDTIIAADLARSFGYVSVKFFNPFTGETEDFHSSERAINSMLQSASQRINALEAELERVKSFLVMD